MFIKRWRSKHKYNEYLFSCSFEISFFSQSWRVRCWPLFDWSPKIQHVVDLLVLKSENTLAGNHFLLGMMSNSRWCSQGRIQDFKLGVAHLKKLPRAEGDAKIYVVFRVKNHDFTQKNLIFPNFREEGGAHPWFKIDTPIPNC